MEIEESTVNHYKTSIKPSNLIQTTSKLSSIREILWEIYQDFNKLSKPSIELPKSIHKLQSYILLELIATKI